jgi:hypothetical protein
VRGGAESGCFDYAIIVHAIVIYINATVVWAIIGRADKSRDICVQCG